MSSVSPDYHFRDLSPADQNQLEKRLDNLVAGVINYKLSGKIDERVKKCAEILKQFPDRLSRLNKILDENTEKLKGISTVAQPMPAFPGTGASLTGKPASATGKPQPKLTSLFQDESVPAAKAPRLKLSTEAPDLLADLSSTQKEGANKRIEEALKKSIMMEESIRKTLTQFDTDVAFTIQEVPIFRVNEKFGSTAKLDNVIMTYLKGVPDGIELIKRWRAVNAFGKLTAILSELKTNEKIMGNGPKQMLATCQKLVTENAPLMDKLVQMENNVKKTLSKISSLDNGEENYFERVSDKLENPRLKLDEKIRSYLYEAENVIPTMVVLQDETAFNLLYTYVNEIKPWTKLLDHNTRVTLDSCIKKLEEAKKKFQSPPPPSNTAANNTPPTPPSSATEHK